MNYDKDYYAILKVPTNATLEEIKKSYRSLAKKYHPDKNEASDAEDKFKEINEAYEILKDPDSKQQYDQYLKSKKYNFASDDTFNNPYNYADFDYEYESDEEYLMEQLFTTELPIKWINQLHWGAFAPSLEDDFNESIRIMMQTWWKEYLDMYGQKSVDPNVFYKIVGEYMYENINRIDEYYRQRNVLNEYIDYSDIYPSEYPKSRKSIKSSLKVDIRVFLNHLKRDHLLLKWCTQILEVLYYSRTNNNTFKVRIKTLYKKWYDEYVVLKFGHIYFEYYENMLLFPLYSDAKMHFDYAIKNGITPKQIMRYNQLEMTNYYLDNVDSETYPGSRNYQQEFDFSNSSTYQKHNPTMVNNSKSKPKGWIFTILFVLILVIAAIIAVVVLIPK